jgi:hypothetical protein
MLENKPEKSTLPDSSEKEKEEESSKTSDQESPPSPVSKKLRIVDYDE